MAIIYSYPPNSNILPTDTLVCTSTVLIGGKPKNQTKSMSIEDLSAYIVSNYTPVGVSGYFETSDLKGVTVTNGIITDIEIIG